MVNRTYLAGLSAFDFRDCRSWTDHDLARHAFYQDCDDRVAGASVSRLRRQAWTPYRERFPLEQFPVVASTSIHCVDDQMVRPDWSRRVAHERLDADVIELPGGHSPFLSRPRMLADVLARIADGVAQNDGSADLNGGVGHRWNAATAARRAARHFVLQRSFRHPSLRPGGGRPYGVSPRPNSHGWHEPMSLSAAATLLQARPRRQRLCADRQAARC